MNRPLISIAMSFRNSEQTLGLAIRSMLLQTFADFELLLADDASTDRSLEVARSFDDPRIVLWSDGKRRMLAGRLNQMIDRARGRYIARMDADDVSYPGRLEEQLRFLEANPEVDLMGTDMLVFRDDGSVVGKLNGPTGDAGLKRNLLETTRIWHPSWMGKTEWYRRFRYDERCERGQDHDMLYRARLDSRFAVLPRMLVGYRQERLSLKKMLRNRQLQYRNFCLQMNGFSGYANRARLAGLTLAKAAVDIAAVTTGLEYRILRHRARHVTHEEENEWRAVWEYVHAAAAVEHEAVS